VRGGTVVKLTVVIPGRPPTPNNGPRNNWAAAAAERKQWRGDAHKIARDAVNRAGWPGADLVRIHVVFVVPTHGRRDWSNLIASLKPLEDGMVDAGVMRDDSLDVIQSYTFGHRYERGIAATEFHVERVDAGGLGL
jgi:crossover junction endodeoxyribonuclease RusA